jgi:hypothetical protein
MVNRTVNKYFRRSPPTRPWDSAHKTIWTPKSHSITQDRICTGNRAYLGYYASKSLPQSSHPPTQLFNHILSFGYFPIAWKSAKVILFLKSGKPLSDTGSHRPISLFSTVSKLLERDVAHRTNSFIHQNHILPPEQFVFPTCRNCRLHYP